MTTNASTKTIGILGGMGPQATIDLYQKIIDLTPATKDQEHVHVIIDSYPQIPDRTKALLEGGEDPLPYLLRSAQRLEQAGAHFLIIPCNTAHAFYDQLQQQIGIPVVHMIKETATYIATVFSEVRTVGLLATTGTVNVGLYQEALAEQRIQVMVLPEAEQQSMVMEAIYGTKGIKAGFLDEHNRQLLLHGANILIKNGAQAIIGGCTEVPLVLTAESISVPFVDPTWVLAKRAVEMAQIS